MHWLINLKFNEHKNNPELNQDYFFEMLKMGYKNSIRRVLVRFLFGR